MVSRYHKVQPGENLWLISRKYAVSVAKIKQFNSSARGKVLPANVKLYIPHEEKPGWGKFTKTVAYSRNVAMIPRSSGPFRWPLKGRLTSGFGRRKGGHHDGIDLAAPHGTKVRAARSGHVIYRGNGIRGYGNLVVIKHFDNYASVYAHLSRFHVRKGQFIAKGSVLGRVGATGRASGPHLHFEIRKDRIAVDPSLYLRR